ncbi:hypothetical protein RZS08_38325, partial [Arthrospira platensis SPKY1]|nr:hypothetical protein [Arthrospira platensis SPKY1]
MQLQEVQDYDLQPDQHWQVFQIDSLSQAAREFQGHKMLRVEAGQYQALESEQRLSGWLLPVDQALGYLAFYVIEPMSDDGLLSWNFFDTLFETQGWQGVTYPILK